MAKNKNQNKNENCVHFLEFMKVETTLFCKWSQKYRKPTINAQNAECTEGKRDRMQLKKTF